MRFNFDNALPLWGRGAVKMAYASQDNSAAPHSLSGASTVRAVASASKLSRVSLSCESLFDNSLYQLIGGRAYRAGPPIRLFGQLVKDPYRRRALAKHFEHCPPPGRVGSAWDSLPKLWRWDRIRSAFLFGLDLWMRSHRSPRTSIAKLVKDRIGGGRAVSVLVHIYGLESYPPVLFQAGLAPRYYTEPRDYVLSRRQTCKRSLPVSPGRQVRIMYRWTYADFPLATLHTPFGRPPSRDVQSLGRSGVPTLACR